VTPASILGEGSFHQFHGGTTTNVADEADRRNRIVTYRDQYTEVRGRPLHGLNKPVHYVGAMDTKAARRTRSRREFLLAFGADRDPVTTTDTTPMPVPEELKLAAIEAIWANQSWRQATWLGHPVNRYPTDLQTIQELIASVRPGGVVLIGDDDGLGGRALHAASVLDQIGTGRVLAVGATPAADRPAHDRVTHLEGPAEDPAIVAQVTEAVGDEGALVVIALGAVGRVAEVFEAYQPLVPVDGYVVVENTVVNGRPVAPGFGPGPHEAVSDLLQHRGDFVPDVARERYQVTFNKNGYLRRVARS
jgi:cephalosporin hydroxylase